MFHLPDAVVVEVAQVDDEAALAVVRKMFAGAPGAWGSRKERANASDEWEVYQLGG